ADLLEPEALEAAVRQARQFGGGETVVISAIKPATLDVLLEKAGAVLARNLGNGVEGELTAKSRMVG
ncbi:MAG TPA: hypothetical protein VFY34_05775, partial [Pyrinomonadaceae bacterium]|nr:hypothetical protein [Pyrinomonadaceae bacterium]